MKISYFQPFGETVANTTKELFADEDADEVLAVYRGYQAEHSKGAYKLYPGIEELLGELKKTWLLNYLFVTSRLGNTAMQYLGEDGY